MAQNKAKSKVKSEKGKVGERSSYRAEHITVLEDLAAVRRRPGMYIGTTGPEGLHHLVWEIFDNSRDEAMAGFCNEIEVVLLPDNAIRIADNGRGVPVDIHKQTKVSALETIMTTLHAGAKFDSSSYEIAGGLHGVGASVVNALSIFCRVEVHRDGGKYVQEYKQGKKKASVKRAGPSKLYGTIVTFEPDPLIFKDREFDWQRIVSHLRQQSYLVKGLRIRLVDARKYEGSIEYDEIFWFNDLGMDLPSYTFYFEGGLVSFVRHINRLLKPVHRCIFSVNKIGGEIDAVEIALQYVDDISSRILPFANNIFNAEGGTHLTGFKAALTRTLNTYARQNSYTKESDENFSGEDALEGLTAVISVKMREIQFEGQTKAKLGSVEAQSAVASVFSEAFSTFLEENPEDGRAIVNKVILALKARRAAKAAKDSVLRKGTLEGMTLPGKLADCQSKDSAESEIFIVEGDSAGGTAKTGRDRRIQAVLPLRGKILNVERARLDRMLTSEQIKNLVLALGTAIGDTFDILKLRYHKIIIASDADVDGAHIRTLLLTLFYRYFRSLIEGGYVYIAQPPLYKVKKGREILYFYTENDKERFLSSGVEVVEEVTVEEVPKSEIAMPEEVEKGKRKERVSLQRYKGLGEMNAEELWETTMDPTRRILKRVTIEDAEEADRIFDMLMGTDVPARKSFIQSNAKRATIDI